VEVRCKLQFRDFLYIIQSPIYYSHSVIYAVHHLLLLDHLPVNLKPNAQAVQIVSPSSVTVVST
jgi:hypothetical protein